MENVNFHLIVKNPGKTRMARFQNQLA